MQSSGVGECQRFGKVYCLQFYPEDGGTMLFPKFDTKLQNYTVLQLEYRTV